MECVSLRLVVTAPRKDGIAEQWLNEKWQPDCAFEATRREVVFHDPSAPVKARILWRASLPVGFRIEGPAVIEEPNATTLLHPGDLASINDAGHVVIRIPREKSA